MHGRRGRSRDLQWSRGLLWLWWGWAIAIDDYFPGTTVASLGGDILQSRFFHPGGDLLLLLNLLWCIRTAWHTCCTWSLLAIVEVVDNIGDVCDLLRLLWLWWVWRLLCHNYFATLLLICSIIRIWWRFLLLLRLMLNLLVLLKLCRLMAANA